MKEMHQLATSVCMQTWDCVHLDQGPNPTQGSNLHPLGYELMLQPTEPHQPGQDLDFFFTFYRIVYLKPI